MALGLLSSASAVLGGGGGGPVGDALGGAATSAAYSDTGSVTITQAAPFGGGGFPWGTVAIGGLAIVAILAAMRRGR